ncbi:MAG: DUF4255 domain-containing protein [Deltaproteobacteria bacterium]|nr:DUF4255 domain-containing protein [Deltaproteobacteria bacterium]
MAKYQIIRDVGLNLLGVVRAELQAQRAKAKAFLATPTAEFLRKNTPSLVLYLYEMRTHMAARRGEEWHIEEEIVDEKGEMHVVRYNRPLELTLNYILVASADDLAEEHELLAIGMSAFLDKPRLERNDLQGDSFFRGDDLHVKNDFEFDMGRAQAILGPLGAGTKVAAAYSTQARLFTGKELGRSRRVRERHIDVFDPLRPPPGSIAAKELGLEAKPPKIVATKK